MAVELRQRFFLCASAGPMDPKDAGDRCRHERLDPVITLDSASLAPLLQNPVTFLKRTHPAQSFPHFIRIKNRGSVAMRVEMDEGVFLIEIEVVSQPVK